MKLAIAFISVVLIWSTTPLAINWSSDGVSFIFGVASRMTMGAILCLFILAISRRKLPLDKQSIRTYIAAAVGIYGAMLSVYWGSQFITSGLVAVIFGLTPMITAVMAHKFLGENSLTVGKLVAVLLGLVGIIIIYLTNLSIGGQAYYGILAMLVAVLIHCGSGIWVKRVGGSLSAMDLTSGALLFVSPLFIVTWFLIDGVLPSNLSWRAAASITYLGIIGSVIGFSLYYYILKHMAVSKVALTTLITPILALLIGREFNSESVPLEVWYGTACILTALAIHQWGDRVIAQFQLSKV